jgi:hypothetical protein
MSYKVDEKTMLFNDLTEEEAADLEALARRGIMEGRVEEHHPAFIEWKEALSYASSEVQERCASIFITETTPGVLRNLVWYKVSFLPRILLSVMNEPRVKEIKPVKKQKSQFLYLLEDMAKLGWSPVSYCEVPHLVSPCGRIRVWLKPRSIHVSYGSRDVKKTSPLDLLNIRPSRDDPGRYNGEDIAKKAIDWIYFNCLYKSPLNDLPTGA